MNKTHFKSQLQINQHTTLIQDTVADLQVVACIHFQIFSKILYCIWNKSTQRVFNACEGMHIDSIIRILFAKNTLKEHNVNVERI